MEVVFAHTWEAYQSYQDYRALVDLSGFESCYVGQIDPDRPVYYVISPLTGEYKAMGETRRWASDCPARFIWWSLERPGMNEMPDFIRGCKRVLNNGLFDWIWMSDRWLVEKRVQDKRVMFVPMGSHHGLALGPSEKPIWDVVHLCYGTGRRRDIWDALKAKGVKVAEETYNEPKRTQTLNRSRFMVNIHQDDWPIMEPLRFAIGTAYGLPILTEWVQDHYPYSRHGETHGAMRFHYDELVDRVVEAVKGDYGPYEAMAHRNYDIMTTEFSFRRCVERAIAKIEAGKDLSGGTIIR